MYPLRRIFHASLGTYRLLAVPQDGHASEEVKPSERNGKKTRSRGEAGEETGKEDGTAFSFEPDVFE